MEADLGCVAANSPKSYPKLSVWKPDPANLGRETFLEEFDYLFFYSSSYCYVFCF